MQLVEAPSLRPFQCVDGTQTAPIVDTLVNVPVLGRVYLSPRMVRDAALLIPDGFVEKAAYDALVEKLADANETVVDLEGQLAELEPVRDALARASARFGELEPDDEPVRQKPLAMGAGAVARPKPKPRRKAA